MTFHIAGTHLKAFLMGVICSVWFAVDTSGIQLCRAHPIQQETQATCPVTFPF